MVIHRHSSLHNYLFLTMQRRLLDTTGLRTGTQGAKHSCNANHLRSSRDAVPLMGNAKTLVLQASNKKFSSHQHQCWPCRTAGMCFWRKSWSSREMLSSLLYSKLWVSSTATTDCVKTKTRYAQLEKACFGNCWSAASQKQRNQHCAFTCSNYTVCPWAKMTGPSGSSWRGRGCTPPIAGNNVGA